MVGEATNLYPPLAWATAVKVHPPLTAACCVHKSHTPAARHANITHDTPCRGTWHWLGGLFSSGVLVATLMAVILD